MWYVSKPKHVTASFMAQSNSIHLIKILFETQIFISHQKRNIMKETLSCWGFSVSCLVLRVLLLLLVLLFLLVLLHLHLGAGDELKPVLLSKHLYVVAGPVPGAPEEDEDQVDPAEDVAGVEEVGRQDRDGSVDLKIYEEMRLLVSKSGRTM